ncbi:MAG: tetratricopeptide repeat protein [Flavobacteriales bacterium]|nr:tetratricopeptide repeat protein [Flavobacteriales bacterium]
MLLTEHIVLDMKNLLTLLLLLLAMGGYAQKHVYEDLLVMYVDEDYEKCMGKAESYTLNDKTRKDPLPYLYMSMCLYEMSKLEKYQADYPKASRDALKYAEKYRKKDKDNEYFANYEDFWAELNTMGMEEGENYYEEGSYSKAKQAFDRMVGYYPENPGAWLMYALCQLKSNLARDAEESLKNFAKAQASMGDIKDLPEDQQKLLRMALIRYAEHLNTAGMQDSARSTIEIGKDAFMENDEFKLMYEDLH